MSKSLTNVLGINSSGEELSLDSLSYLNTLGVLGVHYTALTTAADIQAAWTFIAPRWLGESEIKNFENNMYTWLMQNSFTHAITKFQVSDIYPTGGIYCNRATNEKTPILYSQISQKDGVVGITPYAADSVYHFPKKIGDFTSADEGSTRRKFSFQKNYFIPLSSLS